MAFYNQFKELQKRLEEAGHHIIAPELEFETNGDDTSVGTFFDKNGGVDTFPPTHAVWKKKGAAITRHFRKIDASEAILVTNYTKRGIDNYIGGNTFLEMGYAYGTGKKIFVLNELPATSAYKEEILGLQPVVLCGDVGKIR